MVIRRSMRKRAGDTLRGFKRLIEGQAERKGGAA
jgi:hypothetical protein